MGQRIMPTGYHPLVDAVAETDLVHLGENVRRVIAGCVAAMPLHEQFIDRNCKAAEAA